jgi:hypothetical protein
VCACACWSRIKPWGHGQHQASTIHHLQLQECPLSHAGVDDEAMLRAMGRRMRLCEHLDREVTMPIKRGVTDVRDDRHGEAGRHMCTCITSCFVYEGEELRFRIPDLFGRGLPIMCDVVKVTAAAREVMQVRGCSRPTRQPWDHGYK